MVWWRRKQKDEEPELSLEQKISQAITKCDNEKKKTLEEINQLKKWAQDIIQRVFEVPSKLWYSELENYEIIKNNANNSKINESVLHKTDEVVRGYASQIRIRKSKIELCDSLLDEYYQSMDDFRKLSENLQRQSTDDVLLRELEEHANRLKNMNKQSDELDFSYEKTQRLELIESDLQGLEDEFKMKEEFHQQMNKVNEILGASTGTDLTEQYEEEIKTLIQKIKEKKHEN